MCMYTCYGWPSPRWLCVIQMYQGTSEWDEKSAPIAKREAPTPHQQVVKKERSWVFERSAFWQWFQWEYMYSNKAKMHDNWECILFWHVGTVSRSIRSVVFKYCVHLMIALDHGWPTDEMQAKRRGGQKNPPQQLSSNSSCGCCWRCDQRLLYIPQCRHNNQHDMVNKPKQNKPKQINAQTQTNPLICELELWLELTTVINKQANSPVNKPTTQPNRPNWLNNIQHSGIYIAHASTMFKLSTYNTGLDARHDFQLRDLGCIENEFQPATAHLESLRSVWCSIKWTCCYCCLSMVELLTLLMLLLMMLRLWLWLWLCLWLWLWLWLLVVVLVVVVVVVAAAAAAGWQSSTSLLIPYHSCPRCHRAYSILIPLTFIRIIVVTWCYLKGHHSMIFWKPPSTSSTLSPLSQQ